MRKWENEEISTTKEAIEFPIKYSIILQINSRNHSKMFEFFETFKFKDNTIYLNSKCHGILANFPPALFVHVGKFIAKYCDIVNLFNCQTLSLEKAPATSSKNILINNS